MIWTIAIASGLLILLHIAGLLVCIGELSATGEVKDSSGKAVKACARLTYVLYVILVCSRYRSFICACINPSAGYGHKENQ